VVIVFLGILSVFKNEERLSQDRRSGAKWRIRELDQWKECMVKYSKSLYSRREGVSERQDSEKE